MFRQLSIYTILSLFLLSGCASYEKFRQVTEEYEFPSKIYNVDYNQAWQAVIQVMRKYDLAVQNQETGVVKTRWMNNTKSFNFANSFGVNDSIKAAQFKLNVNIVKGFRGKKEVSKVTIYRRQLIEQDFLQGWKEQPSDGILEKTLLYRITRLLTIEEKLNKIQKEKEKEQLSDF